MIFNKSDRRVHTRIKAISKVYFNFITPHSMKKTSKQNYGILKDLSNEGLFFETTKLPKKTIKLLELNKLILAVSFNLPNSSKNIHGMAKFIWLKEASSYLESNKIGIGAKFLSISADSKELLTEYVNESTTKEKRETQLI